MAPVGYALKNLRRNRLRSTVTILGVASLLFLISFLVSILVGLDASTDTDISHQRLITSHKVSLGFNMPESYWNKIRALPHVVEVSPWNWFGGMYIDERHFFARFYVDPDSFLTIMTELRVPDDQKEAWRKDRQGALVSRRLAEQYDMKLGDRITIKGDIYPVNVELDIRAIYDGGEDGLYFHRKYVEEALERSAGVGTFGILVDAPENLPAVAEAVDRTFADSTAETKTQTEKAFQAGFVSMYGNVKGLVWNLTMVIAVTILLTAANTMAMAIRERTREMAVLRALGFLPGRILALVLTESMAIALLAGVLGVGGFWAGSYYVFVVRGFRPPMIWFPLTLTPLSAIGLLLGTVGLGLVAGLVPALLAARVKIVDGLRAS